MICAVNADGNVICSLVLRKNSIPKGLTQNENSIRNNPIDNLHSAYVRHCPAIGQELRPLGTQRRKLRHIPRKKQAKVTRCAACLGDKVGSGAFRCAYSSFKPYLNLTGARRPVRKTRQTKCPAAAGHSFLSAAVNY